MSVFHSLFLFRLSAAYSGLVREHHHRHPRCLQNKVPTVATTRKHATRQEFVFCFVCRSRTLPEVPRARTDRMALVLSSSALHDDEEHPVPRETELSRFILAEQPRTPTLTWTINKVRSRFHTLSYLDNSSPFFVVFLKRCRCQQPRALASSCGETAPAPSSIGERSRQHGLPGKQLPLAVVILEFS